MLEAAMFYGDYSELSRTITELLQDNEKSTVETA